jgi:hypothetical protein
MGQNSAVRGDFARFSRERELTKNILVIHEKVYEPGKIFYPACLVFTNEERFRILEPKRRILHDAIPEIWERIAYVIQKS